MDLAEYSLAGLAALKVSGEVDHSNASTLDASMRALRQGDSGLLLDLTDCAYLDSGGVSVILLAMRDLQGDAWLGVVGADSNLLRLFEIVGLTTLPKFRVFSNAGEVESTLRG